MKTWTFDNHPPGDGPWRDEPDKAQWIDGATDLDCLAHRGPSGAWCGYVGVPPDHPWHGKHYDDVNVEVHGGLTYSDRCQDVDPVDVWWLGFDCAHIGDYYPRWSTLADRGDVYRTLEYVKGEVCLLAKQVANA